MVWTVRTHSQLFLHAIYILGLKLVQSVLYTTDCAVRAVSAAVVEAPAQRDLVSRGWLEVADLTDLPFADGAFDVVVSADALEHVPPHLAERAVSEMVRVARRYVLASISLKSHVVGQAPGEAPRHATLRRRGWWEAALARAGAATDRALVWALQESDRRYVRPGGVAVAGLADCRTADGAHPAGRYEVCLANATWLVGDAEQANVRRVRAVTTADGQLEPWFFAAAKAE